jgi:uncharacterized heparinase superfamily protein
MMGPSRFRFLNETRDVSGPAGWNEAGVPKLWLYNLHYFDDLNSEAAQERVEWHRALIQRWVDENPPAAGNGWEPYPVSLRVVNWIKWALSGNEMDVEWVASLAMQVRWLRNRLECHLLGNHLLVNAKALVFAGLFFLGDEAKAWLSKGLSILGEQLPEQVLNDGGHFERSPMYHAIILEDLLDLVQLLDVYQPDRAQGARLQGRDEWLETAGRMLGWLRAMSHPDGRISFFNDAAFGVAAELEELEKYCREFGGGDPGGARSPSLDEDSIAARTPLPQERKDADKDQIAAGTPLLQEHRDVDEGSIAAGAPLLQDAAGICEIVHLEESGYVRLASSDAVAIIDVAEIGPRYLPGHAHADTLSFELSLFGQRVFVNSGTSTYEEGAERLRQRGTFAHNTVSIDGENSSEVWKSFRVARRAHPRELEVDAGGAVAMVCCRHDGYRWQPGCPQHEREWRFGENSLLVIDRILGDFDSAVASFHLHPSVAVARLSDDGVAVLRLADGHSVRVEIDGGEISVEDSTWHPEFGLAVPARVLRCALRGDRLVTTIDWRDL